MRGIVFIILSFGLMNCATCRQSEMKASSLEDGSNESLAGYALCVRSASQTEARSGLNIRDCDPVKDFWINAAKYRLCVDATGDKLTCFKQSFPDK